MDRGLARPSLGSPGRALVFRLAWGLFALFVLILLVAAAPQRFAQLAADRYNFAPALAEAGLSLRFFALYFTSLELLLAAGSFSVGVLIAWRRPDDRLAILAATTLVLSGLTTPLVEGLTWTIPALQWPVIVLRFLALTGFLALALLFPNGRFVPRWSGWLLLVWPAFVIAIWPDARALLTDTSILPNTFSMHDALALLAFMIWFAIGAALQTYRYRRESDPLGRQQTRWVLFGFIAFALVAVGSALLLAAIPPLRQDAGLNMRYTLVGGGVILLTSLVIPITLAFAILRYRLWQIDIILNRTLVYGGLTVLITAAYALLVGGVGALAADYSGQIVALALATVIVAVGLMPFHRRWKTIVDRFIPSRQSPPAPHEKGILPADTRSVPLPKDHPQATTVRPWFKPLAGALFLLALSSVVGYVLLNLSVCRDFSPLAENWLEALIGPVGGLAFAVLGLVISYARPVNRIGWLCSVGGLALALGAVQEIYLDCALGGGISPPGLAMTAWFGYAVLPLLVIVPIFLLVPQLFPDGRFLTPRWRKLTLLILALMVVISFAVAVTPDFRQAGSTGSVFDLDNPLGLAWLPGWWGTFFPNALNLLMIFGGLAAITSMFLRLKRSRGDERQQMRLFAYWTGPVTIQLFVFELILYRLVPLWEGTVWHDPLLFAYDLILIIVFLGFPLIIGLAIFKYRLYDIDIIVNRTLVYGGLSLGIVAVYVLVVGALGALFQSQGSFLFALLATGLIAVLFQPVRERVQRGVNHLMFGERDDPYAILSKMSAQLQTTTTPEATLQSVVETIATALKLPYVAIELADEQGRLNGAATGKAVAETTELPLRYQNETVGYLVASPRSPGESFTPREQQLLSDIAGQTGAMAYSVRLTAALQRSREKLVLTREEERRRIRRDLHDELGPTLASQTFALDAVLDLLETDPAAAANLLRSLKAQNQDTVAGIRRLVYELRPPSLDELGPVGALKAYLQRLGGDSTPHVVLTVEPDPLPSLSAAVEVAAYRIVLEAITNVVRHARAGHCQVHLKLVNHGLPELQIVVSDDGQGLPPSLQPGVGLTSMRERAEELGGSLAVEACEAGGTRVTALIPISASSRAQGGFSL